MHAAVCMCNSETRCGCVCMDILSWVYVFMCLYLYTHASEYICSHVNVSMYVGVGRLCMYMCADS